MSNHNLYSIIASGGEFFELSKAHHAYLYYKNKSFNLLTQEFEERSIFEWYDSLDFKIYNHSEKKRVIHLFYEFGYLNCDLDNLISENDLLAIDIKYLEVQKITLTENKKTFNLKEIYSLSFDDYEKKFNQGMEELEKGNCYQFNLTSEFRYRFDQKKSPMDFIEKLWSDKKNIGAFASATYIDHLKKLYLSNSPECLFKYHQSSLDTFPIKGTLKRENENSDDIKKLWNKLKEDKKNEAELFMIIDLLRNDLSKIDLPAAQIIAKKKLLLVPRLIHQYAHIRVNLRKNISLKRVLYCIFPGGSITGAPKKKAMEILSKLEDSPRGFYCGSTILLFNNRISASINIRSSEINFNSYIFSYRAGGGITLKSQVYDEYYEMADKKNSYLSLLNR